MKKPNFQPEDCAEETSFLMTRRKICVAIGGAVALILTGCPPKYKDFKMTEDAGSEAQIKIYAQTVPDKSSSGIVLSDSEKRVLKENPEIKEKGARLTHASYGIIHVWHPASKGDLDGVVVYFHGYNADPPLMKKFFRWIRNKVFRQRVQKRMTIDKFWNEHNLKEQFQTSGSNKIFTVPQSARDDSEKKQTDPKGLLEFIQNETGISTNKNITIIAHSSGGNTVAYWLDDPRVKNVVLMDALYSAITVRQLHKWLEGDGRKLILVSSTRADSVPMNRQFAERYRPLIFSEIPNGLTAELSSSKVILIETKHDHSGSNGLVESKKIITGVLKLCR